MTGAPIIAGSISAEGFTDGDSFMGHTNALLDSGVALSASDETADGPATNAASWLTHARWKFSASGTVFLNFTYESARAIRALGIFRHNLGSNGCTVRLRHSDDGAAWTTLIEQNPDPDDRILFRVASGAETHRFWRVEIDNPNAASLYTGNVFAGDVLKMWSPPEFGWSPPGLAKNDRFLNSRSEGGDPIGRSLLRREDMIDVNLSAVPEAWVRADWEPAMSALLEHPVYFSWDNARFPDEAAFCFTDRPPRRPAYSGPKHFDIGFSAVALRY
ncbi:MAG: hypothetical protein ACLFV8_14690 [Alphaproteobacteria bacterium]